jgi:RNA polymerase sigma factor (sigma-70 family)
VEASAVHAPAGLTRLQLGVPLLRLRSDDQLLDLFRAGNDEAFAVIHDRYRQRLFAYVRQMLSAASRQDAEDVLQDVFVRAYGALRADARDVNLRAWLYRVAHNRCIDHLRRPIPPAAEIHELSRKPLHDPIEEAQRRADLAQLVEDIARLPEQQRSALLMRELDGMSYADLAGALDVTVPAVKSLLVRARIGLVEAAEARNADCAEIRHDLLAAYDRGVKASGRARRHMRSCEGCREYRVALRGMRRSFAALSPVTAGPLALAAAKLLGFGGGGTAAGGGGGAAVAAGGTGAATSGGTIAAASGGAAAVGGAAAGGSALVGGGIAAAGGAAAACKVAAVVCTAALTAGGAVEVHRLTQPDRADAPAKAAVRAPVAPAPRSERVATGPVLETPAQRRGGTALVPPAKPEARRERVRDSKPDRTVITPPPTAPVTDDDVQTVTPPTTGENTSGGTQAPDADTAPDGSTAPSTGTPAPGTTTPGATPPATGGGTQPDAPPATGTPPPSTAPGTADPGSSGGTTPPPGEH